MGKLQCRVGVSVAILLNLGLAAGGCKLFDKQDKLPPGAEATDEVGRPLSDMELPVSLRTGDPAPTGAATVEATTEQLRLDGAPVIALDNGKLSPNDKGDGTIPKLESQLRAKSRSVIAMRLQANLPYETVALVLSTAKKAGIHNAAFQVRPIGATQKTGWLDTDGFIMTAKADDVPPIEAVKARGWNDFTAKWQEIHDACRTSPNGNCAYVNDNFAQGGTLKIELLASGRGLNIDFFRRGLTPDQERDEDQARARLIASKKEDFLQGRISHDDLVEILLLGDPSTYALFQFRYMEALKTPSALTGTMAPMCHHERCGVAVSSDQVTPIVRAISLMGAAFPDGTPAPAYAFEMPWTPRPKYNVPDWAKDATSI